MECLTSLRAMTGGHVGFFVSFHHYFRREDQLPLLHRRTAKRDITIYSYFLFPTMDRWTDFGFSDIPLLTLLILCCLLRFACVADSETSFRCFFFGAMFPWQVVGYHLFLSRCCYK